MNEEVKLGTHEWVCQIITKDGKYLGWGDNIHDRAWVDNPATAITYDFSVTDPNSPDRHGLILNDAEFIKVRKTINIVKLNTK